MMNLFAALLLVQGVPTEADADAAIKAWKAACVGVDATGRITALEKVLETEHEKVINAVAEVFTSDIESVRVAAAVALAGVDHPASADVLVAALQLNLGRSAVVKAVTDSLGALGWQRACPALEALLDKVGHEDVRAVLPEVVSTLGQLGSVSSIGPLAGLLKKMQGPRRAPWPNEKHLIQEAEAALRAITGVPQRKAEDYEEWWRVNGPALKAQASRVFWVKKTQERADVIPSDKAPADALLVSLRITAPADSKAHSKKKKKK